jgi:putative salt-induced outer membrane protein YdiY
VRSFQSVTFITLFVLSALCFADRVTLKNGDRLTGTVVKSDGKTLVLHTTAAGDVTINYSDIQDITTEEELNITLKDGKTLVGPVTTSDGKLEVATKSGGTVPADKDEVKLIRNDEEQEAYNKLLHPGLFHGWSGGANVGLAVARGNSETESLAIAFNALHPTVDSKITVYASSINTTNNLATPSTVANLTLGGFRYDRNVTPRLFVFGAADYMVNGLQSLDLRQVYSGGVGVHAIKSANTTLDFLGGTNYTHETYSNGPAIAGTLPVVYTSYGITNRFVALTLGEELNQNLGKSTVLTEAFYVFPNLQQTGEYRITFSAGTVTKIGKWIGWQNQLAVIDVSNPPVGTKSTDVVFTTGLNVAFKH